MYAPGYPPLAQNASQNMMPAYTYPDMQFMATEPPIIQRGADRMLAKFTAPHYVSDFMSEAPHTTYTPHTPNMPYNVYAARTGPVLVWVFYSCGFSDKVAVNIMSRALLKYEELRGRDDSMHVGLVLAWRTSTGLIEFENTEFGCFTGRESGTTELHAQHLEETALARNFVVQARSAMYLPISPGFAREFAREFGCLNNSGILPQYNHATYPGLPYPTTKNIVRSALSNLMRSPCLQSEGSGGDVNTQLNIIREGPVQCAQFALAPLLTWIAAGSIECDINSIDNATKCRLRDLADLGVGIHPAALKTVFESMPGCNWLDEKHIVGLGGVRTTLGDVCMTEPYIKTKCENQNKWLDYWRKVDSVL